jgi:predicted SnoaL-like aldol condensation-catalyzing enzyme
MFRVSTALAALLPLVAAMPVAAQPSPAQAPTPPPARACALSAAEIAAGRQLALDFFRPGITGTERAAMLAPDYVQHNPVFKKVAKERGLTDAQAFPIALAQLVGGGGGGPPGGAAGAPPPPRPPQGNPFAAVFTDCDTTTILHQVWLQEPGAAPGTWYEAYTFDTFRVRNGKFVEHWDAAQLPQPRPPAPPAAPPAR